MRCFGSLVPPFRPPVVQARRLGICLAQSVETVRKAKEPIKDRQRYHAEQIRLQDRVKITIGVFYAWSIACDVILGLRVLVTTDIGIGKKSKTDVRGVPKHMTCHYWTIV